MTAGADNSTARAENVSSQTRLTPLTREVLHASYPAVEPLARLTGALRRGFHLPRLPALHRVADGTGPQCRRTHHHSVPGRSGPHGRLESPGVLRRIWLL